MNEDYFAVVSRLRLAGLGFVVSQPGLFREGVELSAPDRCLVFVEPKHFAWIDLGGRRATDPVAASQGSVPGHSPPISHAPIPESGPLDDSMLECG